MKKIIALILVLSGFTVFIYAGNEDTAIQWMYSNGLTRYNNSSDFKSNQGIRRDEAAKFFVEFSKLLGKDTYIKSDSQCKFSDIKQSWSDLKSIVVESCKLGLFQGTNGKFQPKNQLTNEQAVTVLVRLMAGSQSEKGINRRSDNYYKKANELNLLQNADVYSQKNIATRGNVGIIIYNGNISKNGNSQSLTNNVEKTNNNSSNTNNIDDIIGVSYDCLYDTPNYFARIRLIGPSTTNYAAVMNVCDDTKKYKLDIIPNSSSDIGQQGLFIIKSNKVGYINGNGKLVVPVENDWINSRKFYDDTLFLEVFKGDKRGIFSSTKEIIPIDFESVDMFADVGNNLGYQSKIIRVRNIYSDQREGVYDVYGNKIIDPSIYKSNVYRFDDGNKIYYIANNGQKDNLINNNGNIITSRDSISPNPLGEKGQKLLLKVGKWENGIMKRGLIDLQGNILLTLDNYSGFTYLGNGKIQLHKSGNNGGTSIIVDIVDL